MNIDWTWFLIGIAVGIWVVPMLWAFVYGLFPRKAAATT